MPELRRTAADGRGWDVLLIGGPSGVGKTIAAERLGRHSGVPWLQVDDLRLALQFSGATLPHNTAALYFFLQTPDVWRLPPERLRDGLIAVGEVMAPAIEIVIANHVDSPAPLVIEGDGILPSLCSRPLVRDRITGGHVRMVCVVEPDETVIFANMLARSRGIAGVPEADLRAEARSKWLFGEWLAREASQHAVPLVAARPWDTLPERIVAAASASPS